MTKEEIINAIAFLGCNNTICLRGQRRAKSCEACYRSVELDIDKEKYIDTELIETTVIAIRNNNGQYDAGKLTNLELQSAFYLLRDLVPFIRDKMKECDAEI